MTCREASNLLPLFVDGELDSRQMRAVALHGTRCQSCETELRQIERVQDLVSDTMHAQADAIDLSDFWSGVESRLGTIRPSWRERVQMWWSEGDHRWVIRVPALAAAAAVAVLAFWLFARAPEPTTQPDAPRIAAVDNAATIESLESDVDSVAVVSDPETRTTVLWVSDETPVGGDVP